MQTFLSLLPWIIVAVVILIILVRSLYVVQQSRAFVIERLGVFSTVWEEGLHVKIPFVEKVVKRISLKEPVSYTHLTLPTT